MALVIGLTGRIGSGKSTVAHYFSQLEVPVIDADSIARELCCSGQEAFLKIKQRFGDSVLDFNGEIDRKKLRKIIFENSAEQVWLETILHPLIIEVILNRVKNVNTTYCIVVVPLLFETSMKDHVDRILVVDSEEEKQIQRAALRDKVGKNDIKAILNKQLSRKEQLQMADDIILNDATFEDLKEKVMQMNEFYRGL